MKITPKWNTNEIISIIKWKIFQYFNELLRYGFNFLFQVRIGKLGNISKDTCSNEKYRNRSFCSLILSNVYFIRFFYFQRKHYVKYAKVFPLSSFFEFKVPSKWYRRSIGIIEIFSGALLSLIPNCKIDNFCCGLKIFLPYP